MDHDYFSHIQNWSLQNNDAIGRVLKMKTTCFRNSCWSKQGESGTEATGFVFCETVSTFFLANEYTTM